MKVEHIFILITISERLYFAVLENLLFESGYQPWEVINSGVSQTIKTVAGGKGGMSELNNDPGIPGLNIINPIIPEFEI